MNALKRLFDHFTRRRALRIAEVQRLEALAALQDAQRQWRARVAAYQAAKARGDTRGQHEAAKSARGAVQAVLRLEIGR